VPGNQAGHQQENKIDQRLVFVPDIQHSSKVARSCHHDK
jgi:hypothetical protein